ncbi:MAG: aspartate aminotransferase family protein [Alphaproteobacteria bacterium]|nr:aspartate aminotransferase family protein [Alphaproteobacteria bacterium]
MVLSLEERERRVIADTNKIRFFPYSIVRGEGAYLVAEDGRRILDLAGTWGTASLGYAHPAVVEAVTRAVGTMASASNVSTTNPEAVALAEELLAATPGTGDRRVWFGHCGSDANDALARCVVAATGRSRFVSFIGGTHGGLSGSLALSGYSAQQLNSVPSTRAGQVYVPYPDPYRPPFAGDVVKQSLDYFQYLLDTIAPPSQVAGVFLEVVMCDAGDIVPPPGFLKGLADLCRRNGILLICDEVKVGLGRTGFLHSFEIEGVVPDIISFGKAIGGGLPLSAVVGPAEILNHKLGLTITTTSGNPVSAAAGRAVLRTITGERLMDNAAARGRQIMDGLRRLSNRHPMIGDVRGRGLIIGVDLVEDRGTRRPATKACAKVVYRAAELGAALFYVGHHSNVLELTPPLTLSEAEADEGLQIIDRALEDVAAGRVSDAAVAAYAGW